jgi:hypothetical protein
MPGLLVSPRRMLAIAVPAAVGATVATAMLVGSHGAATPPVSRLVQRADTTTTDATTTDATTTTGATETSASPTPVPTATPTPLPTQTLIACGNGTYAEFACKKDLPTPTPTPVPTMPIGSWACPPGYTVDAYGCVSPTGSRSVPSTWNPAPNPTAPPWYCWQQSGVVETPYPGTLSCPTASTTSTSTSSADTTSTATSSTGATTP